MERNKSLMNNTLILSVGQLIPKIITLITLPILTKFLTTEEYGIYDLVLSVGSLTLPMLTMLVQQAAFRFIIDERNSKSEIISSTIAIIMLLASSWLAIIWLALLFRVTKGTMIFMITFLYVSESLYDASGQIARGLGDSIVYSLGVIIYSVVNLLCILVLFILRKINIHTIIFSSIVSYIVSFVFIYIKCHIYRYVSLKYVKTKMLKKLLTYSIPIIPSSISLWVVNLSDRILILSTLGAQWSGIYAAANKIPNLCGTAYSVFNLAWTENAARTVNDTDRDDYYTELYNSLFSFLMGLFLLLMVVSPLLFKILIDEKFYLGILQIPILLAGVFYSSLVSFWGGIYVAIQRTKQVGVSSLIGAILNIVINILLIKRIGIFAASVSTVVSYFLIYHYRKRDIKKYIIIKEDISLKIYSYISYLIISILYFLNIKIMFGVGLIVAILYNYKFNGYIIKKIITAILIRRNVKL